MLSAKDFDGLAATFRSVDSMTIIDGQKPIIGRADRIQEIKDFFTANPEIDRCQWDPVNFGKEYGIIWVNGVITCYDKKNQQASLFRFMTLLKRINGQLKDSTSVVFA
ncbi:uncharacterized protein [Amphiura filiformis]|uniref:uncharacterized protein n=1 Tax=Amphiura filiformis TaxID=82378 RepID=UPI003B21DB24